MSDFFSDWFPEPGFPYSYKTEQDFHDAIASKRSRPTADLIALLKSDAQYGDPWETESPLLLAVAERLADLEGGGSGES